MSISRKPNVAVIGAGIAGVTTAYQLARRGCLVTIYDRHRYPAMETSFANGGQLSASNAEVWNSWATVLKGMKWMFTPGAPLLINPKPSWHKISWMAGFIRAIPNYEKNTITTVRLAIEARAHLMRMATDEAIDFDCHNRSMLQVYHSKEEFEHAGRVSALLAKGGLVRHAVTMDEIRSIEPALKGTFHGGYHTPSDFSGDIHKFTVGLAQACERQGVVMRLSRDVKDLKPGTDSVRVTSQTHASSDIPAEAMDDDFDHVVVCAGVASRALARMVGDRVNVYPVKGYSITIDLPEMIDQQAAPWTALLDDKAKIATSRLGASRFRVAGTAEFNGMNRDIPLARVDPLVAWCHLHFPEMSTRNAYPWAGLRPMMPDMLPRVMHGKNPRIVYNTGHGHLGWTLSAATADMAAVLVVGSTLEN